MGLTIVLANSCGTQDVLAISQSIAAMVSPGPRNSSCPPPMSDQLVGRAPSEFETARFLVCWLPRFSRHISSSKRSSEPVTLVYGHGSPGPGRLRVPSDLRKHCSNLGGEDQRLQVLNLSQSIDDTAFPTGDHGVLLTTDSTANSVVIITGALKVGTAYAAVTPGNANSAGSNPHPTTSAPST